jgi:acyl-CoA synthetase (AMP-forming)/AMP-acid ligase II
VSIRPTFPVAAPTAPVKAGSGSAEISYVGDIQSALRQRPDRTVLRWRDRCVTAGEFDAWISRVRAGLREIGVRRGQTVAILTEPNHPAMFAVRYATHLLGGAVVYLRSVNPRTDELLPLRVQDQMLRETRPLVVVVDAPHAGRARSLRGGAGRRSGAARFVVAGFEVAAGDILDLLARPAQDQPASDATAHLVSSDLATVAYTSGSTGLPKAIRQSYRVWRRMVEVFPGSTDPTRPATFLAVTPVSGTVGSMIDAVLAAGGDAILHEGFDLPRVVHALAHERVTDTYLAVPHLYRLLEHADIEGLHRPALRRLIYSGSPAAPHRIAGASRVFGDTISQLYGSTEAGGIAALTPADHCEPELLSSVGRPLPWVELRILDASTGEPSPPGGVGEIWVRSPTTMDGYLAGPAPAPSADPDDGWLPTGDLGHRDRHGYLHLVGRVGNVVKSGGLKLYPATVEAVLLEHPAVAEAVAYGVRDRDHVEHLHAAVSLRRGVSCTADDLCERICSALGPAYRPAALTVWPQLPLTEAGKPDLAGLRARVRTAVVPDHQLNRPGPAPRP